MNQPDTMMTPPVESLMGRTHSKFALVTLSARRAREITSYFKELGLGNSIQVPPLVSSVARKPLSIAFEEIAAGKIVKTERLDYEEMEAEAAEMFGDLGDSDDAPAEDAE